MDDPSSKGPPPPLEPAGAASPSPPQSHEDFGELVAGVRDYAIFLLDPHGVVTSWNAGAQALSGYRAEEIIGQHFSCLHPSESASSGWPMTELRLAALEGRFQQEAWRIRKDGTRIWAGITLTPLYGEAGAVRGFLKIARDLTERRLADEGLRESEQRFRLLVASVVDYAIFLMDTEGRVISWNAGAERIKGYRAPEILGKHFSVFYPPEVAASGWPERELARAVAEGRLEDEGWRVRQDGTRFWANVVITALRDAQGELQGFAKVTRDLTERKQAEEALRQSQTDLEQRVQERTADLAARNRDLRVEAEKRQRLQEELTRHVHELSQMDRSKNEFLATLAHELRNPLAPIRSAVEVLRLRLPEEAGLKAAREIIERQVRHLARLVDDLVDLSRVSRNTLELRREPTSLGAIVAAATETSRPLIEAQAQELQVWLPPQPIRLEADAARLSQALANLLNNAAKFTGRGGHIWLRAEREGGQVRLSVRDDGMGIAPADLGRVFEMFEQGRTPAQTVKDGLGIGLTLVKRLVELHGGTVEAYSEGPGLGSEFVIRLPLAEARAHRAPDEAAPNPPPALTERVRVLVADDNHDAAESLAMMLDLLGAEARAVYDGQQALEAASSFRPQLAILDLGMPRLGGTEVARGIRAEEWGGDMVLAALTGWGQDEDRQRARDAGFDHHLVKPVDVDAIQRLLAEATARRR